MRPRKESTTRRREVVITRGRSAAARAAMPINHRKQHTATAQQPRLQAAVFNGEIGRQLAASGAIDLLALDSAAALTPALELEIGLGDGSAGLQSRILASGFRRLGFAAARTETAILVLNQVRSRSGAPEDETSAGGPGLKLYAAVRIALESAGGAGNVHFRILKSKVAAAFREGNLRLDGGSGRAKTQ